MKIQKISVSLAAACAAFAFAGPSLAAGSMGDCKGCQVSGAKKSGKRDACAVPMTLSLSGLHCGGCEGNVSKSLMAVKGVEEVKVSAKDQRAIVWVCPDKNVKPDALRAAVVKAGYKVVKVEKGEIKAKAATSGKS
jgi:copper chaperone